MTAFLLYRVFITRTQSIGQLRYENWHLAHNDGDDGGDGINNKYIYCLGLDLILDQQERQEKQDFGILPTITMSLINEFDSLVTACTINYQP
mmetsp:Transcript_5629/g.7394  ORF Transcript_5629/g.7394 Transcript_5629/m.7394 type:complete len:92 (+) Transcript_5629:84-359(+)